MITSIEKVVNLARLIDEGGTYICGECPHYDADALKNCARGFAAPSDCPRVIKGAVQAIRLLGVRDKKLIWPPSRPLAYLEDR